MRVSIIRGGGFAGLVKTITVDSARLSPQDAVTLAAKVEEARLFDYPPEGTTGAGKPDAFTFLVTIEDRRRRHRVAFEEESLPRGVRSLISWIGSIPGREEKLEPPGGGSR
jgi:hypothetical protein